MGAWGVCVSVCGWVLVGGCLYCLFGMGVGFCFFVVVVVVVFVVFLFFSLLCVWDGCFGLLGFVCLFVCLRSGLCFGYQQVRTMPINQHVQQKATHN